MSRRSQLRACILFLVLIMWGVAAAGYAQEQPQQEQEQTQKEQKEKKKKKGGFFGGLKAVTGASSDQQEVTATAGSKTIGEGEQIGDAKPTAADRQQVSGMENHSVPEKDLKKFQDDGNLKPKQ